MGIPGLWAELASAAQTTTLPSYCLTTFSENANELRGLRLGIDASLWLFHAHQSSGGANPYLRLLFYRLAKLLSLPVLPLFVFDGPSRPTWKRGKQVKGRQHAIEHPFTQLIEAFGYQWHRAPGEAEAELAHLNQAGLVDAVLTDDSDALLFGAQVLVRNWGKNLSGTRAALSRTTSASSDVFDDGPVTASAGARLQLSGSDRDHLMTLYRARDLATMSNLGIDRDGLILIALMSGGDYDTTGLLQCGVKIALALARGGFGSSLIKAFKASYPNQASVCRSCPTFASFLKTWLEEVREELRTNERGFLPSRRPKLASAIEDSFLSTQESRHILACYVYPLISDRGAATGFGKCAEPDLTKLARLSQIYFNWSKDAILSKFRTILGPGVVTRRLRQETLEYNDGAREGPWAALVESPASKAVRRHMLGLESESAASRAGAAASSASASKAAAIAKKQRPLHESPNATRITDFFAKAALHSSPNSSRTTTCSSEPRPDTAAAPTIDIQAIKLQRRHAALAPFLDYRVLVAMDEFIRLAELGIDPTLDAELAASRAAQNGGDDTDIDAAAAASVEFGEDSDKHASTGGGPSKRVDPTSALLMWIPEPLLELSVSGKAPLAAFLKEMEKKAAATRAKGAKKTLGGAGGAGGAKGAGQTTLTSFVRPLAKPSISDRRREIATTTKSFATSASASASGSSSSVQQPSAPRTPRQLRVPSSMQRGLHRTESVPVPAPLGTRSGFDRTTSLPAPAEHFTSSAIATATACGASDGEPDMDSSIEFLGSFVSNPPPQQQKGMVHARSSTPPNSSEVEKESQRPHKSPKKTLRSSPSPRSFAAKAATNRRGNRSQGMLQSPSQRALAELESDDSDEDEGGGEGCGSEKAASSAITTSSNHSRGSSRGIRNRAISRTKPRISTITISSDSDT